MKVTNRAKTTLGLPRVGSLEPGQSTDVPDEVLHNKIVAAWVSRGMLEVHGKASAAAKKPDGGDGESEAEEKDRLIAELAELGIKRNKRSSLDNLRATLADARAEAEESGDGESEAEEDADAETGDGGDVDDSDD